MHAAGLDKPKPNGYTDHGSAVDELRDLCITGPGTFLLLSLPELVVPI